ncbi:uncharacterized protein LOC129756124 [Uranotaenia lowii]|uniref:uncharacterized protein LOC129756124 n=1 Tax=Uranotaenia lowii TaxID=190385 RepID=UPI002478BA26|nr:uncharacterized protein LOC129756124 [Uranotaenia lowii]
MSIGINLRVTGHTSIGGRKYQEDFFSVAYQQTENDRSLEYAFFGIYDGHGGAEASLYAKEHLMDTIVSQKLFWSENDDDVLKAIREGYIQTHYSMWREQDKWPKTSSGLPSTAGTTASIAFIRKGKIYIGHVGDSGIVLGYQKDKEALEEGACKWGATPLTEDHKPEAYAEKMRIMSCGGKVVTKSGVPRVVWNRPRIGHKGPVRRSTPIDEIPFLAVARSLGDLWSYNSAMNEFVVSPNPDVSVIEIDPKKYRCLIFGTDGLWNVLSPKSVVEIVHAAEMENIRIALEGRHDWKNPSKLLVNEALKRWSKSNMKADNTSVVIIMLDPPGPSKRDVLRSMRTSIQHINYETLDNLNVTLFDHTTRELIDLSQVTNPEQHHPGHPENDKYPESPSTAASFQDMIYSDSFAESYNTYLNTTNNSDHSYTNYASPQQYSGHQQQHLNHTNPPQNNVPNQYLTFVHANHDSSNLESEEPYSLTNLQTKSERLHSEMLQASTSNSSIQRYSGIGSVGNSGISENFHDYPLPSMPYSHSHHSHDIHHYAHVAFQHQSHPTYPMERYDYHQNHSNSYSNDQHYATHDLPEQNYSRDLPEYMYPAVEHNITHCLDDQADEAIDDFGESSNCIESTRDVHQHESVELEENFTYTDATCNENEARDEDIQINEISSSNLNALSPPHDSTNQSDSDSCTSGDEASTSSLTTREIYDTPNNKATKLDKNFPTKSKGKVRKTIRNIVKIVYATRSTQRPQRTRGQQENVTSRRNNSMRSRLNRFLTKNQHQICKKTSKICSALEGDEGSASSTNNNNNLENRNLDKQKNTSVERRVLRSADQVKPVADKPHQRSRRIIDTANVICTLNRSAVMKTRTATSISEGTRKISKRKILIRKVTSETKRVKR